MPTLTTPDGAPLWCEVTGQGEAAVVLVDGLGCDGFIWRYLRPALARRFRVVRFHHRGHGESGLPPGDDRPVTIGQLADDLAFVMERLEVPRAAVFGHSMGVQVILELHARHPERVAALVPVCGSYGNVLDTWHDDTLLKRAFPLMREVVERFPRAVGAVWKRAIPTPLSLFIARYLESRPDILSKQDMWPYLEHLGRMDPRAFVRTLEAAGHHSAWGHLGDVDVPTLIIAGERDLFTPMWLSERMHARIADSELLVVPTASHCAPLEFPGVIELVVERFLRDRAFPNAPVASAG